MILERFNSCARWRVYLHGISAAFSRTAAIFSAERSVRIRLEHFASARNLVTWNVCTTFKMLLSVCRLLTPSIRMSDDNMKFFFSDIAILFTTLMVCYPFSQPLLYCSALYPILQGNMKYMLFDIFCYMQQCLDVLIRHSELNAISKLKSPYIYGRHV